MRLSPTALARGAARRPWLTLAMWGLALVAAAAAIVLVLPGSLTAQYSFLGNPDSKRGRDLLQQKMDLPQKANEVVIVRSQRHDGRPTRRSAPTCSACSATSRPSDRASSTASPAAWRGGDEAHGLRRRPHRHPPAHHGRRPDRGREEHRRGARRRARAPTAEDGFSTLVTGTASINSDFSQTAETDLRAGEGIGVPIALVILLLVFGALVAATLPVFLSLIAITVAVALDGARRPDLRHVGVRRQHDQHDGPGHRHRLLAVHRLALPRGAGARDATRSTPSRSPAAPPAAPCCSAASPWCWRCSRLLLVPTNIFASLADRRHPRGGDVGRRGADPAAGGAQPAGRPRQQPQGAVPGQAAARRPRQRTYLAGIARAGPARHAPPGARPRRRRRASCCSAPPRRST